MKFKNIIFILLGFFFFVPNLVLANEFYTVESYQVDVVVNDDSSYDIVETIDVNYFDDKVDFYWNLNAYPGYYYDETILDFFLFESKLSDIKTNIDSSIVPGSITSEIIIPSTSMSSSNTQKFIISYTINHTKDLDRENDYFMLDVIKEFSLPIDHIKFTITMPDKFNKNDVIVRKGDLSSVYDEEVVVSNLDDPNFIFYVDGNKIIGEYKDIGEVSEIVTIFLKLPDGYFKNSEYNLENINAAKISIVLLIISIFIFIVFRKYKKGTKIKVSKPYNDMSSLEVAYLYNRKKIRVSHIYSVLLSLANKGYIDIYDGLNNFCVVKNKAYAGNDVYERMLFERLFVNTDKVDKMGVRQVVLSLFKDMKQELRNNCVKYYTSNFLITISNLLLMIMMIVVYYFIVEMCLNKLGGFAASYLNVVLLCSIPLLLLFIRGGLTLKILFFIAVGQFLFIFLSIAFVLFGVIDFTILVILMVVLLIIYIFYCLMPYGKILRNDVSDSIYGLKNFTKNIDINELNNLIASDSNYFFKVLPYSYSYGTAYNLFKVIDYVNIEVPCWYHNKVNNINSFKSFVNNLFYGRYY